MKFLKHIRSKSGLQSINHPKQDAHLAYPSNSKTSKTSKTSSGRPNPTAKYPKALLEQLLSYVCPHAKDDAYTSCEDSMKDGGCMLCDMRDLAHCALANQQWSEATQNILYHNIRIDSVHYCDREVELAADRDRQSSSGRHGSPPQERLRLLSRTVRENGSLAQKVHYIKLPYMMREGSVADLARTISYLPNLLYVDLPDSVYMDDPLSRNLGMELQARCPRIRQMRYLHGAENSFQTLAHAKHWPDLEAIELAHLTVEATTIVDVLTSLTALREVKLVDMLLDDSLFESLPPLVNVHLQGIPNISVQGLVAYVSQPHIEETLAHLLLIDTGVQTSEAYQILSAAKNLSTFHIGAIVSRALPISKHPPLASPSLKVLHYEISNDGASSGVQPSTSDGYYAYLSKSILSGSLPLLCRLYALSNSPQNLLQPAPRPSYSTNRTGTIPPPLSLSLTQPLQLYTKAVREMEWNITLISPPNTAHSRGSTTTTGPDSLYHAASLSPQYRNTGRNSVVVGNGFGGFLTVPSPSFPPGTPQYKNKKKDVDAWMG